MKSKLQNAAIVSDPAIGMKGNSMRLIYGSALAVVACLLASSTAVYAQPPAGGGGRAPMVGGPGSATADGSRAVTDGGIKIAGWTGKIDASEEKAGMTINDAKLSQDGKALHVTTGPATTY
jgi:hypothetical protein